ncbi:MAG: cyclic nucleotide-binding domain-containing protein, partial [Acidobacteriota bacterium]
QAIGGRVRVERIKQGEVFGLLMLLDEKPYSIDIVARTRCSVLEIHHESIMALFDRNPRIFAVMTLNICRILGRRLKSSYNRMAELKVAMIESENINKAAADQVDNSTPVPVLSLDAKVVRKAS